MIKKKTVDSFFSLGVENFKNMVKEIRRTELALGRINYNISYSSRKNMNSRRSIYISNKINKGDKISRNNVRVVRPNFGLHPKFYKKILGKRINRTLAKGTRFKLSFISRKRD